MPFQPISEEFRSYLEDLQASGRVCVIRFKGDNDGIITLKARITDLYNDDKEGYLRTDTGIRIRLDRLIQIDVKPAQFLA